MAIFLAFFVLFCFVPCLLALSCDPKKNNAELNPNQFIIPDNYSRDKLLAILWFEHFQWTLGVKNNDTWPSFFMNFTHPSQNEENVYANFNAGGKPKTKCFYFNGSLIFNISASARNLNMKVVRKSGAIFNSSTWLLNAPNEPFFAMIQCDGVYRPDWSGYNPDDPLCQAWRVSLYFMDSARHTEDDYARAKAAIEDRICFSLGRMIEIFSQPSQDCVKVPGTHKPSSGNKLMARECWWLIFTILIKYLFA